ncbi:MAG: DUF4956 domain-containing protein [Clostridiales bacterium]|nr:DUF4956 domain-containing protein [Clostridiales bacterium]
MLDLLLDTVISDELTLGSFALCTAFSLVLGFVIALTYKFKTRTTASFALCLAMLPAAVQLVIMLVNGNVGAGVAVAGAFGLVRFRSAPGSAREIVAIFLAMAVGLATGMGYIGIAVIFTVVMCIMTIVYTAVNFGGRVHTKELRITIPEDLDYSEVFDDILKEYTIKWELVKVKTTNMGSLFQLTYLVEIVNTAKEKEFIDKLRCRNGNLEIVLSRETNDNEIL